MTKAKPKPEAKAPAPNPALEPELPLEDTPPEQTLAAIIAASSLPEAPSMEGFVMSDDPLELPPLIDPNLPLAETVPPEPATVEPVAEPTRPPTGPKVSYVKPSTPVRYESRIEVLEAFRYPGSLLNAPDWVDRNWVAWADTDEVTKQPAGPALRVPMENGGQVLCRVGDYIVKQNVRGDTGSRVKTEVWAGAEFERIFVPAITGSLPSVPQEVPKSTQPARSEPSHDAAAAA